MAGLLRSALALIFFCLLKSYCGWTNDVQAKLEPSENRECATCHVMWLKGFKKEGVKTLIPYDPTPVVETGKQNATSTKKMCFSCHDGFVLDARDNWNKKSHGHPVGIIPSAKVSLPTVDGKQIFPLNEDGKVYCGTCHTAHGVDWEADDSPVFMRIKSRDGELCEACHQERDAPLQLLQAGAVRPGDQRRAR